MRLSEKIVIGMVGATCLFVAGTTFTATHGNSDRLVQATINGHNKTLISKDEMLEDLTTSSAYSQAESISVLHAALVQKYGNKYVAEAQKIYLQDKGKKSTLEFSNQLKLQGLTPRTFLYSLQNIQILQHEIEKTYKPSHSELETAYKSLPQHKYWLRGVYLTDNNGKNVSEKVKKQYIEAFESNQIERLMKTAHAGYSVSGIGLGKNNININEISSNNYGTISPAVAHAIKDKKAKNIVSGVDPGKGVFVVQIYQVKDRGSFKANKDKLIRMVKEQKSQDTNEQTKLGQKVLKELNVRAVDNQELNENIKSLKR